MDKLLTVDDDITTVEQIKNLLLKEGESEMKFGFCRQDKSAQTLFKTLDYSLVVMEVCSTDVDGYALIRHIKHINNTPIIVMFSGNEADENTQVQIEVAKSLGADYVLSKSEIASKQT
jgi:CheY-like chemotaxis protein